MRDSFGFYPLYILHAPLSLFILGILSAALLLSSPAQAESSPPLEGVVQSESSPPLEEAVQPSPEVAPTLHGAAKLSENPSARLLPKRAALAPRSKRSTRNYPFAFELHGSVLNDLAGATLLNLTFGWSIRLGQRFKERWGVFFQVEQNLWQSSEVVSKIFPGTLNIAIGGEILHLDGFIRSSLAVGSSTLLFRAPFDDVGQTGGFVDFRPIGIRWKVAEEWALLFDPLSFAVVAPQLSDIPLVRSEYRTTFSVEGMF